MNAKPNKTRRIQILVATGFSLPLVTLFMATLLTYSSSQALWETFQWVPFSQRVEDSLGDLLATVEDAELGQRGWSRLVIPWRRQHPEYSECALL